MTLAGASPLRWAFRAALVAMMIEGAPVIATTFAAYWVVVAASEWKR